MPYTLHKNGETNFSLNNSEDTIPFLFTIHYSCEGYFTRIPTKDPLTGRDIVYLGHDIQEAITKAYETAKEFAKNLDPNFQDLTLMGELEQKTQTVDIPKRTIINVKEVLVKNIPKEQIPHLNDL